MAATKDLAAPASPMAGRFVPDPADDPEGVRAHADRAFELALKRALDIVGAIVAIILFSPIMLVAALVILARDGRPILFRQPRAGLLGRPFSIVKFRTMRVGADAEREALRELNEVTGSAAAFKLSSDPRVTHTGNFLRRSSIDELPQFWNVLRGEMSLVGPRPHPFDDVARYEPWHARRLSMKPGVTGLWQVSARRDADFDRWVELDLEYIDHWSLFEDIKILLRTFPALVRAEGR